MLSRDAKHLCFPTPCSSEIESKLGSISILVYSIQSWNLQWNSELNFSKIVVNCLLHVLVNVIKISKFYDSMKLCTYMFSYKCLILKFLQYLLKEHWHVATLCIPHCPILHKIKAIYVQICGLVWVAETSQCPLSQVPLTTSISSSSSSSTLSPVINTRHCTIISDISGK